MKVLFVGLGGIGQRHLRNFRRLLGDSLEPIAYRVRGDSPTLTDTLQVESGVDLMAKYEVRAIREFESALDENPDLVVVSNPSSMHVETAAAAIGRNFNVFVEKPLAHTTDGVAALVEEAERSGVVGAVGYQLRFHPCVERAHTILRDDLLGRVVSVRAQVGEYLPGWHKYEDYRQMYASRRDLGGGVILSQIHELDYLYWMFGMPTRLFTIGGHLSQLEIDVEDVASTVMQMNRDGRPLPVQLHQDYLQRPPARGLEVVGTDGKLAVDLTVPRLERYDGHGELAERFEPTGFQRNDLFLAQTAHVIRCVRGEEAPLVSLRDGARSTLLALAARSSMVSGKSVDLDSFAASAGMAGI